MDINLIQENVANQHSRVSSIYFEIPQPPEIKTRKPSLIISKLSPDKHKFKHLVKTIFFAILNMLEIILAKLLFQMKTIHPMIFLYIISIFWLIYYFIKDDFELIVLRIPIILKSIAKSLEIIIIFFLVSQISLTTIFAFNSSLPLFLIIGSKIKNPAKKTKEIEIECHFFTLIGLILINLFSEHNLEGFAFCIVSAFELIIKEEINRLIENVFIIILTPILFLFGSSWFASQLNYIYIQIPIILTIIIIHILKNKINLNYKNSKSIISSSILVFQAIIVALIDIFIIGEKSNWFLLSGTILIVLGSTLSFFSNILTRVR